MDGSRDGEEERVRVRVRVVVVVRCCCSAAHQWSVVDQHNTTQHKPALSLGELLFTLNKHGH
jgi:hypothetical protein